MKQILSDISKQPKSVKRLIANLVIKAVWGNKYHHSMTLDDKQKAFLKDEGIPFSFNSRIMEWEIIIQEES